MSDLTIVTPPDTLLTNNPSFLLIYPSSLIKEQFQQLIVKFESPFTLYMYEIYEVEVADALPDLPDDEADKIKHDVDWLLKVCHIANFVILDIDNCPTIIRDLSSYIIANTNTFWLTKSTNQYYNKLSVNQIFNLDFLASKVGDYLETKQLSQPQS